jgi:hypothetical protein
MENIDITKQEKILLAISEIAKSTNIKIKFEDIAVALFKKFPKDFHLKGYDEYPDSGDSVKRALYTLRDRGILSVNNMIFSLTEKGIDLGKNLSSYTKNEKIIEKDNLDRYILNEINRIKNLESFNLFKENKFDEILMTDMFNYLGVSVRTKRMDFKAKLNFMNEVMEKIEKNDDIYKFHNFIIKKFEQDIEYKLNKTI